jgi:hypothetical protein
MNARSGPLHNNLRFERPSDNLPKTVWVAAPPKSGSTWLSMMLSWLLDWPTMSLIAKAGRQEQELRIHKTFVSCPTDVFLPHTHTKANETTIAFVKNFKVRVIIPTRNIPDTLMSVHDHLIRMGVSIPVAFIPPTYKTMSEDKQKAILIRLVLPWYINFYASWAYAHVEHGLRPLYVAYESMRADPTDTLRSCMRFIGLERADEQFKAAVEQANNEPTRFNYGLVGRGMSFFSHHELNEIDATIAAMDDPIIQTALIKVTTYEDTKAPRAEGPALSSDSSNDEHRSVDAADSSAA